MNATVNVWTKIPKEFQFRCYSVPTVFSCIKMKWTTFFLSYGQKLRTQNSIGSPSLLQAFFQSAQRIKENSTSTHTDFFFLTRIHCPWSSWCTQQFLGRTHWPESGHLLAKPSSVENQYLFTYNPSLMLYFKIKHLFFLF